MLKASLRHLGWWSLMLAMLIAVLLLGLRLGLPRVADYRQQIAAWMSQRLDLQLSIGELQASWSRFYPALTAGQIRLDSGSDSGPDVSVMIDRLELQLDPWRSLLHWQPVFDRLQLSGVQGHWQQGAGQWLAGAEASAAETPSEGTGGQRLLRLLLMQPRLELREASLELEPEQGPARRLEGINALLENLGEEHQFSGEARMQALGEDARLSFAIQFEGLAEDPQQGDFPFYLKLENLGPELFRLVDVDLPLERLRAGTEFWGRWRQGRLDGLQGRLALGELEYGSAEQGISLTNSHLDFALFPQAEGYQLQLTDLLLNSAESRLALPALLLEGRWEDRQLRPQRVLIPQLELAPLSAWLGRQSMLPRQVRTPIEKISPQGRLSNLTLSWPEEGGWQQVRLRADAEDVGVDAYYGAPRIRGASGLLEADLQGGVLHLQTDDFALHFPKLYAEGWQFSRADGRVEWQLGDSAALIHSDLLHLADDSVSAAGRFSINIPYEHEEQTELTLLIGMTDSDGRQAQRFTPPREVGEQLHHWLGQAIQGGRVRQAGFLLHGGTRNSLASWKPPGVQLFFDVGQATLDYDPAWPEITDGDFFLYIHNGDLRVDLRQGQVMQSRIQSGWAYKPLHEDGLKVITGLEGPAGDLSALLRSEPLNQSVGQGLDDWQLEGDLQALLDLEIPLKGQGEPRVAVDAQLSQGRLGSQRLGLQLEALSGPLSYSSSGGLSGGPLSGRLLNHQVQGNILTEGNLTRVRLQGRAPLDALKQWLQLQALQPVRGELPYQATLSLCNRRQNCQNRFELQSSLAGTAVDLPADFGLAETQQGRLQLTLGLDTQQLDFNYQDRLRGRFDLASSALRGTLHLGPGGAQLYPGAGLHVNGRLPRIRVSDLLALGEVFAAGGEGDSGAVNSALANAIPADLRLVDLELEGLQTGVLATGPLIARLEPQNRDWLLHLEGASVAGDLTLPGAVDQPIQLDLSRLQLQRADEGAPTDEDASLAAAGWDELSNVPPIDLSIDSLVWDGRELGRWRARLRQQGDNLRISDIEATMDQLQLTGELNWLQGGDPHTGVTLELQGEDMGTQLEKWRLERVLESRYMDADVQLEWPGSPWAFSAAGLDGAFQFKLKTGRLIESGNSANLLRVFSILNFNTLGRRLRLDFTDLFKKGVVFDRLVGDYSIHRGIARTETPLLMEGPSADLQATGTLDFVDETVDKEMQVMLPLTSNVPFAAVLLGAPQVAGAVFLIDKLIGDRLEKVTTLSYHISGDWSDPQVALTTALPLSGDTP